MVPCPSHSRMYALRWPRPDVPVCDQRAVEKIVTKNIARESRLHTDESKLYFNASSMFAAHETVVHTAKEYVRGDVHTNSAEGYFSIFKRGMRGIYQHCAEKHLHRYLAEYDFRYNHRVKLGYNDGDRATLAVKGAAGKRLTYRQPRETDLPLRRLGFFGNERRRGLNPANLFVCITGSRGNQSPRIG